MDSPREEFKISASEGGIACTFTKPTPVAFRKLVEEYTASYSKTPGTYSMALTTSRSLHYQNDRQSEDVRTQLRRATKDSYTLERQEGIKRKLEEKNERP
ncbi:hypothetical protein TruAng_009620 [Truncatella angustata]|nr:hypothetical protein TruAng_009620 [Truncatella angustata]